MLTIGRYHWNVEVETTEVDSRGVDGKEDRGDPEVVLYDMVENLLQNPVFHGVVDPYLLVLHDMVEYALQSPVLYGVVEDLYLLVLYDAVEDILQNLVVHGVEDLYLLVFCDMAEDLLQNLVLYGVVLCDTVEEFHQN